LSITSLLVLAIFFLIGTFFLTALISAFRRIQKRDAKLMKLLGAFFFYRPFHLLFFSSREYESLFFSTICAQNMTRFGYAACAILFLLNPDWYPDGLSNLALSLSILAFLVLSFLVGDYLPRLFGTTFPETALRVCAPFSSPFLFIAFPIAFPFIKISDSFSKTVYLDHLQEPDAQTKQELIELIQEAQVGPSLDPHDKKLIESVLSFRGRIAREVMVPRVDIFSLSASMPIREAALKMDTEGYSRVPVYRNTVDNIVGVLMYKDILSKFNEYESKGHDSKILEAPIESIQKNILFVPETKKLSTLLQEFRKKQVHLAVVVDEYGGTEGIVTIEDILEEIVGDISDEYDIGEELYVQEPSGGWVVDARMNIMDAEDELGITIPQEGDYDTIGGYIFNCTGTIPSKGFTLHHDDFDIEIISSDDRSIDKVRIRPITSRKKDNEADLNDNNR
jgi:putative hemolysin